MLAANCIKRFELLLGGDTEPLALVLQALSSQLARTETYQSFEAKFWNGSSPPTKEELSTTEAWALFEPWVLDDDNRQKALQLLSALVVVLDFEANRPYGYWYDEIGKLDLTVLDKSQNGRSYVNVRDTLLSFAEGTDQEKKKELQEIAFYLTGKRKRFLRSN